MNICFLPIPERLNTSQKPTSALHRFTGSTRKCRYVVHPVWPYWYVLRNQVASHETSSPRHFKNETCSI